MKTKSLLPLICLFAASALPGSAALVAFDTFTGYTAGALNGQNKGFGWSGGWTATSNLQVTTSSGLTHSSSAGTGGAINSGTSLVNGSETADRSFSSSLPATGDVYFGFLMSQTGSPHAAVLSMGGGVNKTVYAGAWNNAATWRLARNDGGTFSDSNTTVNESTATFFFVLKLSLTSGSDTATLFVNPANTAALSGVGNTSYSFTSFAAPTGVQFLRLNDAGDGNATFDEVRVGTAAADMFAVIPEPSSTLLGGLGLLALLRRRR